MNSVFVNTQGLYQRRRAFNMSYRNDLTCNLGELLPVYWQDLIPNSSWACTVHGLVRFLPMIAPIMDNVDLYIHFWQSPDRILYGDDFTKMITGELEADEWPGIYFTGKGISDYLSVYFAEDAHGTEKQVYITGNGSIFDLLGYDSGLFDTNHTGKLNARKFILYFRLLRNWYTNENVEPIDDFFELTEHFEKQDYLVDYPDGNISELIAEIVVAFYEGYKTAGFATHAWPKDYFTSALPTLQFGTPVTLPLGVEAPVIIPPQNVIIGTTGDTSESKDLKFSGPDQTPSNYGSLQSYTDAFGRSWVELDGNLQGSRFTNAQGELSTPGLTPQPLLGSADLSEATAISINELRIANALQVFKEREMRYGRKAPEYYKGFYGVTPGDLRLQLPKFLGGGRIPVNISDIEQTSQTTTGSGGSAQGNLAGKGTAIAAGFARAHTFVSEETLILGMAWLMPKVTYSKVLSRHDTKLNDRFDYYNPSFAHIGEQEVFKYEIYAPNYGTPAGSKEFGYQPRYTEYRFHMNEMHGEFKSTLSYWTLGRLFQSQPAFNSSFIYMKPVALNRIFAVQTNSLGHPVRNVLASLKFNVSVIQPLSRYGTPGLMP